MDLKEHLKKARKNRKVTKEQLSKWGSKGQRTIKEKYGPEYYSLIRKGIKPSKLLQD